ncbi:MAG: sensor histidine kinase [Calditrichaeota bacterium]|nr:MAG: sensor histidine kinase [Calditrichota bacterium]
MLMAKLLDEKVEIATELGADRDYIAVIQAEEISRQMMVGTEGVFFLVLVLVGAWIIYRALVINERLKFAQQNFLMGVTHELKTPLASMKIYLDTLKSEKIPNEKKLEIIPRLKNDVDRLEQLVENILEAGRFEKSGYKVHKELFDIVQLINYSADTLKDHSLKQELVITKHGLPPELLFYGDRYALKRAIESILENSLKYSDKDRIEVDLTFEHDDKNISLTIADNGIGLEKKDTSMIFERFYRVGQVINQSKPGTGLGLFLAKEIIKAHGGDISAQSDGLGCGVQFTIQLKVMKHNENNIVS